MRAEKNLSVFGTTQITLLSFLCVCCWRQKTCKN